ncbi:MAG TPA: hypothetical protein PLP29_04185 [Candidatus Ozemobacteraceae bacterium]|nr:hypothetical protein [Candidatus Ozemobacteraceae bacterium]
MSTAHHRRTAGRALLKRLRRRLGVFLLTAAVALCCWILMPAIADAAAWALNATRWTDRDEAVYSDFVARLGESGHGNLNRFIRDRTQNPLYGEEDQKFNLSPDCADFPYLIRAYVAYKLRLPFGYVCEITKSSRGDERYSRGNRPKCFKDQDAFSAPQKLFGYVTLVNSGYYRMAPAVNDGDTYPVRIGPDTIRPGAIYYDPNGHVALVYKVTEDGRVRLIDAHPDRSVSRPWFGGKFALGSADQGGGFRKWRPMWYGGDGQIHRVANHNIDDYSADDQYRGRYEFQGMNGLSYFDYVRARLSSRGGRVRPIEDFRAMMEDIHEDVRYRALAVDLCIQAGIHRKSHPGELPWNIYGTDGEWESYSTPSRDARLKVAIQEFFHQTVRMVEMAARGDPAIEYGGSSTQLAAELLQVYDELSPQLTVTYTNSAGQPIRLSLHQVIERLFDLSFDPYHAIEYRWGARGEELKTAPGDTTKVRMYERERRLRNQLERLYNVPTPLAMGPERPPDIDVRNWLAATAGGAPPRTEIVIASAELDEVQAASPRGTGPVVVPVAAPSPATHAFPNPAPPAEAAQPPAAPRNTERRESPEEAQRRLWKFADTILGGAEAIVDGTIVAEGHADAKKSR